MQTFLTKSSAGPPASQVTGIYLGCENGTWSTRFSGNSNGAAKRDGCPDEYAWTDGKGNGAPKKGSAASVADGLHDSSQYVYHGSGCAGANRTAMPSDGNSAGLKSTLKNEDASFWDLPDD